MGSLPPTDTNVPPLPRPLTDAELEHAARELRAARPQAPSRAWYQVLIQLCCLVIGLALFYDPDSPVFDMIPAKIRNILPKGLVLHNGHQKGGATAEDCPYLQRHMGPFWKFAGDLLIPKNHPPVYQPKGGIRRLLASPQALTFFYNGSIWLGNPDSADETARCLAVIGSRVAGVAYSENECEELKLNAISEANATSVSLRDLEGRFLMPGLIDPHVHLLNGGLSLSRVNLQGVRSKEEFIERIATAAQSVPEGGWLLGGNWDQEDWGGELPTASWIDAATSHAHVYLTRMCGHAAFVNSRTLALAQIDESSKDPLSGGIAREASGRPSGVLRETAMALVSALVPPASLEARRKALRDASVHALNRGITTLGDMGQPEWAAGAEATWNDYADVLLPAADHDVLPVRVSAAVPLSTWTRLAEQVSKTGFGYNHPYDRLHVGWLKEFADGGLGARTALLHEPYLDDPLNATHVGLLTVDPKKMAATLKKALRHGKFLPRFATHAIGDRAVDEVLSVYEAIEEYWPDVEVDWSWLRIEHAQHISGPEAAKRMAQLGVIAVINPQHLLSDGPMLEKRLGAERAAPGRSYAWRVLAAEDVRLACGSDWPVVPLDPLESIHASIYRKASWASAGAEQGAEGALTGTEALMCHTYGAAVALGLDGQIGSLLPGKLADMALLSFDPRDAGRAGQLPRVEEVWVEGLTRGEILTRLQEYDEAQARAQEQARARELAIGEGDSVGRAQSSHSVAPAEEGAKTEL